MLAYLMKLVSTSRDLPALFPFICSIYYPHLLGCARKMELERLSVSGADVCCLVSTSAITSAILANFDGIVVWIVGYNFF